MIITLIILGWVACGFAAVYLAGIVDKDLQNESAPIEILFLAGPVGLLAATSMYFVCILSNCHSILKKVYAKGLGK